jgi:hypothetical protein
MRRLCFSHACVYHILWCPHNHQDCVFTQASICIKDCVFLQLHACKHNQSYSSTGIAFHAGPNWDCVFFIVSININLSVLTNSNESSAVERLDTTRSPEDRAGWRKIEDAWRRWYWYCVYFCIFVYWCFIVFAYHVFLMFWCKAGGGHICIM